MTRIQKYADQRMNLIAENEERIEELSNLLHQLDKRSDDFAEKLNALEMRIGILEAEVKLQSDYLKEQNIPMDYHERNALDDIFGDPVSKLEEIFDMENYK